MAPRHSSIVLFYKYFLPSDYPLLHEHASYYERKLQQFQKDLCDRLSLKGRVLVAAEGINGTVSAESPDVLQSYMDVMEEFDLVREFGMPEDCSYSDTASNNHRSYRIFQNIDWKTSNNHQGVLEPFPDLKVSIVKEIISTGSSVSVEDIRENGGTHLPPSEFHRAIMENPDAVLIDVRNTFEYEIGHFVHPTTQNPAMNPGMVTFSSFESSFCDNKADELKGKKVLMYCTGGIRCEKASVMLKKRGVADVSQLKGGIHRYLEEYGDQGLFRGLNFVFDQRVAMSPAECQNPHAPSTKHDIVGTCVGCQGAFDELCGSRVCTVCRDLVLVCPTCQDQLREYHCMRHSSWKECYFTFLEIFSKEELLLQNEKLLHLRETFVPPSSHKNVRRTISRQIEKVSQRIDALGSGLVCIDPNAPRRCRSCMESLTVCDGRCWGFWKTKQTSSLEEAQTCNIAKKEAISIGDFVQPGPHWNDLRYGSKIGPDGKPRRGAVVELKSWGSGSDETDCVAVKWFNKTKDEPLIYRWGTLSRNGIRMYDLKRLDNSVKE
jgi:predicted sulfurtransferase